MKKYDPYEVIFWAIFIGMGLGGLMMVMLAVFATI